MVQKAQFGCKPTQIDTLCGGRHEDALPDDPAEGRRSTLLCSTKSLHRNRSNYRPHSV
jgi:hypothetical protein